MLSQEEESDSDDFAHDLFKISPKKLADICHTDSTHLDKDNKSIVSSNLIMEFGGYKGLADQISSNLVEGVSDDIEERRRVFGRNSFPPPKIKTICELIMENFHDPINMVLLAAAVVSITIGLIKDGFPRGLIDGTSIVIALMIIIIVNSVNNYISERRLANLVNLSNVQEVAVYRGSSTDTTTIDGRELVVGDVIKFQAGMKVPADCIMFAG